MRTLLPAGLLPCIVLVVATAGCDGEAQGRAAAAVPSREAR